MYLRELSFTSVKNVWITRDADDKFFCLPLEVRQIFDLEEDLADRSSVSAIDGTILETRLGQTKRSLSLLLFLSILAFVASVLLKNIFESMQQFLVAIVAILLHDLFHFRDVFTFFFFSHETIMKRVATALVDVWMSDEQRLNIKPVADR